MGKTKTYIITNCGEDHVSIEKPLTSDEAAFLIGIFDELNARRPSYAPFLEICIKE